MSCRIIVENLGLIQVEKAYFTYKHNQRVIFVV